METPEQNEFSLFKFKREGVENTLIATTGEVRKENIQNYFTKLLKDELLPDNTKMITFCGYHCKMLNDNSSRSKMTLEFPKFPAQVKTALREAEKSYKGKKKYVLSGNIQHISLEELGDDLDQRLRTTVQDHFDTFTDSSKNNTVIFLAACSTDYSDLKEYFHESGIFSVLNVKKERGAITAGKCFKLDETQADILKKVKEDQLKADSIEKLGLKHVFLSGSFGTGKTVILVELCWMRIYFFLRKFRENLKQDIDGESSF